MPESKGQETVTGIVREIVYQNKENGYTVCAVEKSAGGAVTMVGTLPMLAEGEELTAVGAYTHHPNFGRQFKVESFTKRLPATNDSVLAFLSSGAIKGIGPVTAKRIVDRFGKETLDVLEHHPDWLCDVQGISPKKAADIGQGFASQAGIRSIMLYFGGKLSPAMCLKIYKRWGTAAIDILRDDPYLLCAEIDGIGFSRADELAAEIGVSRDSPKRVAAGIAYVLDADMSKNGHCYLPYDLLAQKSAGILGVPEDAVYPAIASLVKSTQLVAVKFSGVTCIYTQFGYETEKYCAEKLAHLEETALVIPIHDPESAIAQVEGQIGVRFAALQKKAVESAVMHGVSVVTGGPGTGKTTIIRAILALFDKIEVKTMLAAPTGRAAKRMSEATGKEAKTIHRLLEVAFSADGHATFARNEDEPLDAGAVIIDECSMVDIGLLFALLKAIKPGTRLILIGDSDQLPPVGPGDALRDIIQSGLFAKVELNEIFRQAGNSMIVLNAHRINRGEMPMLDNRSSDFFFLTRTDGAALTALVCELCTVRLPKTYGFDPRNEIQVISPTRKGDGGVAALNAALQAALNPPGKGKREKKVRDVIFRTGDKVMQIRNNYTQPWTSAGEEGCGVFNGDIGTLEDIDEADEAVIVRFDDRRSKYDFSQFEELEHAYAVTVHKSQGSEYRAVVLVLYDTPPALLTRNMLYTAVTRSKELVVIVGKASFLEEMIRNNRKSPRYTGLEKMLRRAGEKTESDGQEFPKAQLDSESEDQLLAQVLKAHPAGAGASGSMLDQAEGSDE